MMFRNSKLKIAIGAVALVLFFVGVIALGVNIHYNNTKDKIEESKVTVLDSYNTNKQIAQMYLKVYNIIDENSYQITKNEIFEYLSRDMQKELFPTASYTGLPLHRMDTSLISVEGTNKEWSEVNTFVLTYNLKGVNYNQDITNLIDIQNGEIIRVVRVN